MRHTIVIASIYVVACIAGVCTFEKVEGKVRFRLRFNRHALVDLMIAGGYVAVGAAGG